MDNVIPQIAAILTQRHWTIASAESCTGGLIAAAFTDVPGSSQWFDGSLVTYTIPWKCRLLNIDPGYVEQFGVVSRETAAAMAKGLIDHHHVQAAVSTTGIAGPTGAEPGKPVGTVFVAVAVLDDVQTFECHFQGDRQIVRTQATQFAIKMLLDNLRKI